MRLLPMTCPLTHSVFSPHTAVRPRLPPAPDAKGLVSVLHARILRTCAGSALQAAGAIAVGGPSSEHHLETWGAGVEHSLSSEMKTLISRVAAYPRGLAFLHLGHPECVAVMFGVHAFVVMEAKEYLETPEGRTRLIQELRDAQTRGPKPGRLSSVGTGRPPHPAPPHCARELIEAAEHHRGGLAFLEEASPEFIAVTFHVHPDLVFKAREVLERWRSRKEASRKD